MYPLIFFNGVSEAQISYDFTVTKPMVGTEADAHIDKETEEVKMDIKYTFERPTQASFVEYNIAMDTTVINENLDKRFLALETAIRNLFWKEVRVRVLFNDKKVYESTDV
jgi:hypothetical protein